MLFVRAGIHQTNEVPSMKSRAFCVLVALFQRDELSLGKDVIWKCRAQECQKCGIAVWWKRT